MQRTDSLEKTLMLGKTEGGRRRGRQGEIVGWHHWLNGQGFGWTPGVCDGQGGLTCFSSLGLKESDMTEQLNWSELNSPNVINYTICILLVSQDYYFLYYQGVWLSLQWKWWLDLKQLIKCIAWYMINDFNSVSLDMGRCNKGNTFLDHN